MCFEQKCSWIYVFSIIQEPTTVETAISQLKKCFRHFYYRQFYEDIKCSVLHSKYENFQVTAFTTSFDTYYMFDTYGNEGMPTHLLYGLTLPNRRLELTYQQYDEDSSKPISIITKHWWILTLF